MICRCVLILMLLLIASVPALAQMSSKRAVTRPPVNNALHVTPARNAAGAEALRATSLCARDEKTVWSCETTNRKIASICSSGELDERRGYVQYRFGRPGHVELEFPQQRQNTQTAFTYKRYTRPLITYLAIKFKAAGYTYKIYDESNDEEKPRRRVAHISVVPPAEGAKPFDLNCRQPIMGTLMGLEDVVTKSTSDDLTEP